MLVIVPSEHLDTLSGLTIISHFFLMAQELNVNLVPQHIRQRRRQVDGQASVLLQAVIELVGVEQDAFNNGATSAVLLDLLLAIEEELAPEVEVTARTSLLPIAHQAQHHLR